MAGEKANKKVYLALLVAVEYVACTDEPCLWDLERVGTPLSSGELADGYYCLPHYMVRDLEEVPVK